MWQYATLSASAWLACHASQLAGQPANQPVGWPAMAASSPFNVCVKRLFPLACARLAPAHLKCCSVAVFLAVLAPFSGELLFQAMHLNNAFQSRYS